MSIAPPQTDPHRSSPNRALQLSTVARVGLRRAGVAICTDDQLQFQLDHALARDAVKSALDVPVLLGGLRDRHWPCLALGSAAHGTGSEENRKIYLRRPDLGRQLRADSIEALRELKRAHPESVDIAFVIADGLSSLAVERHALPTLDALRAMLPEDACRVAPVCVATQARVAIGDEIGQLLQARCVVVLIGERPGLSAPDSLGIYITWSPQPGRTDAERNCVSNIRSEGLAYREAAGRVMFYLNEARRLQCTGITLKQNALPSLEASS